MPVNPQKVLNEASNLIRQGRYAESLDLHLWFHHHALEHSPSLSSVRLSFALASFGELAKKYKPAREAMIELRDRNAEAVLAGDNSPKRFRELVALNRFLADEAAIGGSS